MLIDLLTDAQAGNQDAQLALIKKFNPLLKKYGRKLQYDGIDDGYEEMIVVFLELLSMLNLAAFRVRSDGVIVTYLQKAIYGRYIKVSKHHKKRELTISQLSEAEAAYSEAAQAVWTDFDSQLFIDDIRTILSDYEFEIVLCFLSDIPSTEMAKTRGVYPQAVYRTKKRAFQKIRKRLDD